MDWLKSTKGMSGASSLGAILFWLCFFPANIGWLGWCAMVPWLLALNKGTAKGRLLSSTVFGLVFFGIALNWMRVADVRMIATWVMLGVWSALFFVITGYFSGRVVDRFPRLGWTFAFPLVLIPLDWLRSMALEGFPWYYLGHTQHDWLALIQVSDLAGVYSVTFAVAMVNGFICDAILWCAASYRQKWSALDWAKAAIPMGLVCGFLAYGHFRIQPVAFVEGSELAVLQANHPQGVRNSGSSNEIFVDYRKLSVGAVRHGKPLILIWPETSFPATIDLTESEIEWQPGPVKPDRPSQLVGASTAKMLPDKKELLFNSAVLFDPTGTIQIDHYDKIHRVPFGEYVPFKSILPFMNWLAPYETDYSISSGEKLTRFPVPYGPVGMTFGAAICYESGDAPLFRQLAGADGKPAVDFYVNQSNDGWFHGTEEHEQHFLLLRFRAIETRRPVIRAVNMGISGWIDSWGRVLAPELIESGEFAVFRITDQALPTSEWAQFKKNAFSLVGLVPVAGSPSLYVAWGDWFPALVTLGLFGALLIGRGSRSSAN